MTDRDALIARLRGLAEMLGSDGEAEAQASAIIREAADALAAPPPEPQAMPPIAVGDVVLWRGEVPVLVEEETQAQHCRTNPDVFSALYKPVWTREPRR